MDLYHISEDEAYQRIRTLSMKRRTSVAEIAQLIIKQSASGTK